MAEALLYLLRRKKNAQKQAEENQLKDELGPAVGNDTQGTGNTVGRGEGNMNDPDNTFTFLSEDSQSSAWLKSIDLKQIEKWEDGFNNNDMIGQARNRYEMKRKAQEEATHIIFKEGLINPECKPKLIFDFVILGAILYSSVSVPLDVALDTEPLDLNSGFFWFNRVMDVFFLTDIALSFVTAQRSEYEVTLIRDHRKIFNNYLKGWFFIDFFSSVPFDVLFWMIVGDSGNQADIFRSVRLLRASKILRLLKMLRLLRVQKIGLTNRVSHWTAHLQSVFDISTKILAVLYTGHCLSCLYLLITPLEDNDGYSLLGSHYHNNPYFTAGINGTNSIQVLNGKNPLDQIENKLQKYTATLYFTFTYLTSTGYGDFIPEDTHERAFMIFALTAGSFVTTYFVSTVVHMVATRNSSKLQRNLLYAKIDDFLLYRRLPPKLQKRIRKYVRLMHSNTFEDENEVLNLLSPCLRREVVYHIHDDLVHNVPFFKTADVYFISDLSMSMTKHHFAADDILLRIGDIQGAMYFIKVGECLSTNPTTGLRKRLCGGDYFNEWALLRVIQIDLDNENIKDGTGTNNQSMQAQWDYNPPQSSFMNDPSSMNHHNQMAQLLSVEQIVAVTWVEALSISTRSFKAILWKHPRARSHIRKYLENENHRREMENYMKNERHLRRSMESIRLMDGVMSLQSIQSMVSMYKSQTQEEREHDHSGMVNNPRTPLTRITDRTEESSAMENQPIKNEDRLTIVTDDDHHQISDHNNNIDDNTFTPNTNQHDERHSQSTSHNNHTSHIQRMRKDHKIHPMITATPTVASMIDAIAADAESVELNPVVKVDTIAEETDNHNKNEMRMRMMNNNHIDNEDQSRSIVHAKSMRSETTTSIYQLSLKMDRLEGMMLRMMHKMEEMRDTRRPSGEHSSSSVTDTPTAFSLSIPTKEERLIRESENIKHIISEVAGLIEQIAKLIHEGEARGNYTLDLLN